jgi:DNA (cytosine-5)-methyltransferase 1
MQKEKILRNKKCNVSSGNILIDNKKLSDKKNTPIVFSFFSGSGFLDFGFEKEGYNVAFVNEISPSFLRAYKYSRNKLGINEPKYGYYNIDINAFLDDKKTELKALVENAGENGLVGFIGGPPCPDFSVAGKNKGADGLNGKLSLAYVNLIIEMKPDFFVFENVKGLWSNQKHKAFFNELKEKLHLSGYCTSERLCNALEFAVPQDRDRVIMFGVKQELVKDFESVYELENFPWTKYMKFNTSNIKSLPWINTNNFGDEPTFNLAEKYKLLTVEYWFQKNDVENHPNAKKHFAPRSPKIDFVDEGDVSRKSCKRLHRFRYSPTAAYGNNEVHLHPYKKRRISAAEAMAIQSLPKEFELPSDMSLTDMFKTIGNGVPFLMAKGIAKTIRYYLEENVCKN